MKVEIGSAAGSVAYLGGLMAVPEPFLWSWSQMVCFNAQYLPFPIKYMRSRTSHHTTARNVLVQDFLGDWLFMLDTDHSFEPDILWRLLHRMQTHDLDVVCGLYQYKHVQDKYSPMLYVFNDEEHAADPTKPKTIRVGNWDTDTPLFQVDAAGGGCLLVKRHVFARILSELGERPFDTTAYWQGEDIAFFDRLRRLHPPVRAWVDTRVECNHLAFKTITLDDFEAHAPGTTHTRHAPGVGA